MHHVDLAWSLAGAADDHLTARQRLDCYVALGAGDLATAIEICTEALVRNDAVVPGGVGAALRDWRNAHPATVRPSGAAVPRTADAGDLVTGRPARYLTVRAVYRARRSATR